MKTYLQGKTYVTGKLLIAKVRTQDFLKSLVTKENGDTNFVSIMLILLVVIAVAVIFRDKLVDLAEKVFSKLTEFTETDVEINVGGAGGAGE